MTNQESWLNLFATCNFLISDENRGSWVPVARISLIILLSPQSVDNEKSRVLEAMRPRRLRTASAINAGGNVIQTVGCRQLHINKSIACQPHHPRRLCLMVGQSCIFGCQHKTQTRGLLLRPNPRTNLPRWAAQPL